MKKSTEEWLIAFSYVLPGASQYVNHDKKKAVALSSVAILGLILFLLPVAKFYYLGLMLLAMSFGINAIDVMFQPMFDSIKSINESLEHILVIMEKIEEGNRFMQFELAKQNALLAEISRKLTLINPREPQKFLPAPEKFLLLPVGIKPMLMFRSGRGRLRIKKSRR
jgi:hypothetical protein